jgi:hypothetical protein
MNAVLKGGYTRTFSPFLPWRPPKGDRCAFVEHLLQLPQVDIMLTYGGVEPEVALQRLLNMGVDLNGGNPYLHAHGPVNDLRRCHGFHKALGANHTCISWIDYGIPPRFHKHAARTLQFRGADATPTPEETKVRP